MRPCPTATGPLPIGCDSVLRNPTNLWEKVFVGEPAYHRPRSHGVADGDGFLAGMPLDERAYNEPGLRGRLESRCFPSRASKQELVLVSLLVFQEVPRHPMDGGDIDPGFAVMRIMFVIFA